MNARRHGRFAALRITVTWIAGCLVASALMSADSIAAPPASLDARAIGQASGATATTTPDGVVKIGWPRTDVTVTVDGMTLPPAAGLGSWGAVAPMGAGGVGVGATVGLLDEGDGVGG